jgi:hypothetical protein
MTLTLLIPKHLERGFPQHCEVQRWSFRSGIREDELMSQHSLAAARRARNDVERLFREARTASNGELRLQR